MQITVRHRWVRVWQWILAVALPAFVIVGRGLLGVEVGWMAIIGIVAYAAPTILALLLPPALTRFDREARDAKGVRQTYALACFVMWGGLFLCGLSIPDASDNGHLPSAVSLWLGLSYEASEILFYIALMVAVVAWAISLAVSIAGIATSRKPAP